MFGRQVLQKNLGCVVLVVAARTLCKTLRRNVPTVLAPDLEGVLSLDEADVVHHLVEVLDRELRSILIGSYIQTISEIKKSDVWKCIQSGVVEVSRRYVLVKAIETEAELI